RRHPHLHAADHATVLSGDQSLVWAQRGTTMSKRVEFENIEELRRRAGIEDVELREAIRGLRVGDFVRITPLTGGRSSPGHTLLARITRIESDGFRGKVADWAA